MAVTRLILALVALSVAVSGCGIKRPLMRPKDIPAYEKKRAEKFEKFTPKEKPAPTQQPDATTIDLGSEPTPTPAVPQ